MVPKPQDIVIPIKKIKEFERNQTDFLVLNVFYKHLLMCVDSLFFLDVVNDWRLIRSFMFCCLLKLVCLSGRMSIEGNIKFGQKFFGKEKG